MSSNGDTPPTLFASWWARDIVTAKSCTLSRLARALLMLLASYANAANYCNPSVEVLARGLGNIDRRNVQRARAELVAAGLVILFAGGAGPSATNGYWLAVRGTAPSRKGGTHAALTQSTGAAPTPPLDIHKGGTHAAGRAAPTPPEVDNEVSRKRARVSSPPPHGKSVEEFMSLTHRISGRT